MPNLFENLRDYLKDKSNISDRIGTGPAARIYKHRARQGVEPPFIVIEVYPSGSAEHLGGPAGVAINRVEIICYDTEPKTAWTLAEAIRIDQNGEGAALQGYRGTMADLFVYGVTSDDGYEAGEDRPPKGSDAGRYWISRDYEISFAEDT